MKHLRRIFVICLAAVMMCVGVMTVRGDDIPSDEEILAKKAKLWGDLSRLSDKIPEEYTDYFLGVLSLEKNDEAYISVTNVEWYSEYSAILISIEGFAKTLSNTKNEDGHYLSTGDAGLRSMVIDKDNGIPVAYYNFGYAYSSYKTGLGPDDIIKHENILIVLPDKFDINKYELVLYWDITTFNDYSHTYSISDPVGVNLSDSYAKYGDFNKDEKIDLFDVSLMLKHIARWKIPKSSYSLSAGNVSADSTIDLSDCTLILKKISGWDIEFQSHYTMLNNIENLDNEYTARRNSYLYSGYALEEIFFSYEDSLKRASGLEYSIKNNVWGAKCRGFDYLEVLDHYFALYNIDRICILLNCSTKELADLIYEAYNAKWIIVDI